MCRFARVSYITLVGDWELESKLYHSRRGRERGKEKEKSFQNSSLC